MGGACVCGGEGVACYYARLQYTGRVDFSMLAPT